MICPPLDRILLPVLQQLLRWVKTCTLYSIQYVLPCTLVMKIGRVCNVHAKALATLWCHVNTMDLKELCPIH